MSSNRIVPATTSRRRRVCVFCAGRADSVEHVFKRNFKKTLDVADFERQYSRVVGSIEGGGRRETRPDPLFELKVRRVCRGCNNGWMNLLDLHVEPWIVAPDDLAAFAACDRENFRRWAIKVAVMRTLIDDPNALPPNDAHTLYAGGDIEGWHVLVGRAHFKEWRHALALLGVRSAADDTVLEGIVHASWALGTAVVTALRVGGESGETFFGGFLGYNGELGEPLVEIPPGSGPMPDLASHSKLAYGQTEPIFLAVTPDPASPIADTMERTWARMAAEARDRLAADAQLDR